MKGALGYTWLQTNDQIIRLICKWFCHLPYFQNDIFGETSPREEGMLPLQWDEPASKKETKPPNVLFRPTYYSVGATGYACCWPWNHSRVNVVLTFLR